MDLEQAIDLVVARTKHETYRRLCDEENPDRVQRDAYRSLVLSLATEIPLVLPDSVSAQMVPFSIALVASRRGGRNCWYSTPEPCGCAGVMCAHKRRSVGLRDCIECLGLST